MTTTALPHTPTTSDVRMRRLATGLRIIAVGWVMFFATAIIVTLFDLIDAHSTVGRLVMWGHGGEDYVLMIATINIVMGIFLFRSASDPLRHRFFLDFVLAANAAHMAVMLIEGIARPDERLHLVGDIPAGIMPTLVLAILWLPVRARVALPHDQGRAAGALRA